MSANEKDATQNEEVASGNDTDSKHEAQSEGLPPEERQDEGFGEPPAAADEPSATRDEWPEEQELGDESVSDPVTKSDESLATEPAVEPVPGSYEPVEAEPWSQESREPEPPEQDAVNTYESDRHPESTPSASRSAEAEEHYEHEDHHEEAEGSSFAARALTLLIVLIIGAGLGIWGAPKLAPMLPAGMAPVAEWLSPATGADNTETEERIAALSGRIDELNAQIQQTPPDIVTAADVEAAVAESRNALDSELGSLRTAIEDFGGANTAEQISGLQSALDGQASELASFKQQLAETSASASDGGQIDVYVAELEGLRSQVNSLTQRVASLGHRIDEVAATADRSIDAAEARVAEIQEAAQQSLDAAAIESDIALIRAALASGQPFEEPAQRLSSAENVTLPAGLSDAAASGVPTVQTLRDRFPAAAHDAIRSSIQAQAGDGFLDRSRAFVEAQLATRSLAPQEGEGTDAVLSRMEDSLRQGDLSAALTESEQLPSEAASAMSEWLDDAKKRQAADAGLAELESSQPAMN